VSDAAGAGAQRFKLVSVQQPSRKFVALALCLTKVGHVIHDADLSDPVPGRIEHRLFLDCCLGVGGARRTRPSNHITLSA